MAAIPIFAVPKKSSFYASGLAYWGSFPMRKAKVAHLVEHDLAKVGVAGSSPVFRSRIQTQCLDFFLVVTLVTGHPGGGTGRRAGLKIQFPATEVRVQLPSGVLF